MEVDRRQIPASRVTNRFLDCLSRESKRLTYIDDFFVDKDKGKVSYSFNKETRNKLEKADSFKVVKNFILFPHSEVGSMHAFAKEFKDVSYYGEWIFEKSLENYDMAGLLTYLSNDQFQLSVTGYAPKNYKKAYISEISAKIVFESFYVSNRG